MSKRIFIVHGWDGSPKADWYPWLKRQLEKQKGVSVEIVKMPDPSHPVIADWVHALFESCGLPDKDTYFVGHSIGCQTILRYLESVNRKFGGAVFVAPWFKLSTAATPTSTDKQIARPWTYSPIDLKKIRKLSKNFTAIFSEDDPYVPLENAPRFKKELGAYIILEKKKGHYTKDDGIVKSDTILNEILGMVR